MKREKTSGRKEKREGERKGIKRRERKVRVASGNENRNTEADQKQINFLHLSRSGGDVSGGGMKAIKKKILYIIFPFFPLFSLPPFLLSLS